MIKAINDRVIIKRLDADSVSAGGIHLPGAEKPERGEIVACGPGAWDHYGEHRLRMAVAVGDKVLFGKYSGQTFKLPGVEGELLALREDDIIGILD